MAPETAVTDPHALNELIRSTTTAYHPDASDTAAHLQLLREMRDREAIRALVHVYTRAVDDFDLEALLDLFTEDGAFVRRGKPVEGRAALREMYDGAMRANQTMVHVPDAHVVRLLSEEEAVGWASGHGELVIDNTALLARFRYDDTYRKVNGRWQFARRSITFKQAIPIEELGSVLPRKDRMRWPGTEPGLADFPENLANWAHYHA